MKTQETVAKGLGWFSLGLGLAQLAAPGEVARLIGAPNDDLTRNTLRGFGLRGIASGVAILASERPVAGVWSRVAGDVLDLTALGMTLSSNRSESTKLTGALAAVAGVTLVDLVTAISLTTTDSDRTDAAAAIGRRRPGAPRRAFGLLPGKTPTHQVVTINRAMEDVRKVWTDVVGDEHGDAVRFVAAPGGRGTEIHVEVPGKARGLALRGELRKLKQVLETGEVMHSDASIHNGPHPARPTSNGIGAAEVLP